MSYEMNRVAAFINFMELNLWNNVTPVFLKLGILFLVFFNLEKPVLQLTKECFKTL